MDVLELMIIDEITDVLQTDDENFDIGRLSKGSYQVLLPKGMEKGDKIIHIRPGTVIENKNIKIPEMFWSEKLSAYLAPNQYFKNRRVNGIVIEFEDLLFSDEFKNSIIIEVGNPIFPVNPLSEEANSLDYFNAYGIASIENYLYFKNYKTIDYKPSRFKFLNIFSLYDNLTEDTSIEIQTIKNSLEEVKEKDEDGNPINCLLSIEELFQCLYIGIIYNRLDGKVFILCRKRVLSFELYRLNKVIKKYKKLIKKAKSKEDGNYLDEAILYILTVCKPIIEDLIRNTNENDGNLLSVGGPLIGKKVLDNFYNLDNDYELILNFLMINSTLSDEDNRDIINSIGPRNISNYLKSCELYEVIPPLKFITNFEEVKNIIDKFNEGDFDYIQSEFINKYLISPYSEKLKYGWMNENPQSLELVYFSKVKDYDKYMTNTFSINNENYEKYLNKKQGDKKDGKI